ncbi:MAG: MerR family transcriptional regulator [Firmicutes bacterium]|nr:MerR family transcriptional regulator [Bacillota bacterium]
MNDEQRRELALFPIGIVQKLTELSARQIRYYEQHGLISPNRTEGRQRLFSFNDVERLLEIKALIDRGLNIAGIRAMLQDDAGQRRPVETEAESASGRDLSDEELHSLLLQELMERAGRRGAPSLIQGELSRFFGR